MDQVDNGFSTRTAVYLHVLLDNIEYFRRKAFGVLCIQNVPTRHNFDGKEGLKDHVHGALANTLNKHKRRRR